MEATELEGCDFAIVDWSWDCGRAGDLDGTFYLDRRGIAFLGLVIERRQTIYFGEVLGKHSEVHGEIEWSELEIRATGDDARTVARVLCGGEDPGPRGYSTISGWNPLAVLADHISDEWAEEDDEGEPVPNPYGRWVKPTEWDQGSQSFVAPPLDPWGEP